MGREGIEGYSDKTGGRVEINSEDRHGGPIASESSEPPVLSRGAEWLLAFWGDFPGLSAGSCVGQRETVGTVSEQTGNCQNIFLKGR